MCYRYMFACLSAPVIMTLRAILLTSLLPGVMFPMVDDTLEDGHWIKLMGIGLNWIAYCWGAVWVVRYLILYYSCCLEFTEKILTTWLELYNMWEWKQNFLSLAFNFRKNFWLKRMIIHKRLIYFYRLFWSKFVKTSVMKNAPSSNILNKSYFFPSHMEENQPWATVLFDSSPDVIYCLFYIICLRHSC